MTGPEVSFIMPVWKPRPEWLLAAVNGMLAQRGVDFELIIVDDGNDVPAADLLAGIADPRVRIDRIDHSGLSVARTAGTAISRGQWLRFVDHDDVAPPDSTMHLLQLGARSEEMITYGATLFCDEHLQPLWKMVCDVQGYATEASLTGRFTTRIHCMLFPRRVADLAGSWDPAYLAVQDKEWCLRAFEHAPVRGDTKVAMLYRKHAASSTQRSLRGIDENREVVQAYFQRHPELQGTRLERRAMAAVEAQAARICAVRGSRRRASSHLLRAARLAPEAILHEGRQSWSALTPTLRRAAQSRLRGGGDS